MVDWDVKNQLSIYRPDVWEKLVSLSPPLLSWGGWVIARVAASWLVGMFLLPVQYCVPDIPSSHIRSKSCHGDGSCFGSTAARKRQGLVLLSLSALLKHALTTSPSFFRPVKWNSLLAYITARATTACGVRFSSVYFSSLQDGICALGKAHNDALRPVSQEFPECCP